MSNLRRDDNTYGMPWVRCAGPLAVCLYQAAEDYCHRELSGATIPKSELEIALPWTLRPGEYDAAIEQLIRVARFEDVGDAFFLPRYFIEQESDEDQKSTRAKQVAAGKSRAATAKRDANGRMEKSPAKHQPLAGRSSQRLDSGSSSPASGPSGPSGPSDSCRIPPSAAASASPSLDTGTAEKSPEPEAVRAKPARPKRAAHPRYKPTLDAIDAIYREATGGQKPDWSNPKERAAVDRLARAREVDEIVVRARRFWIDHLPGFVWQGKLTIPCVADFASHFPRLAIVESTNGHYASNGLPDDFVPQRIY